MFDTHAHVHDPAFDADRELMLARARDAGVERILTVGTNVADSRRAIETARAHDLDFSLGIHPHEAKDAPADVAAAFDELIALAGRPPAALGEMGLDYYYDHSPREEQRHILVAQLRYARAHPLPLIFHQRDAFEDFVSVLRAECAAPIRGVVHCFTGNTAQARALVDEFDLKLGIGGVLTFKNAEALREAVRDVGLAHLILETDAPYLAPVPHRGQRNEPAFVAATADLLATVLGVSRDEVDERTSATAAALFGSR
jgi:TatD DNase family protein